MATDHIPQLSFPFAHSLGYNLHKDQPARLWTKGGSVTMKRQVFIGFLLLCLSGSAYANPIVFDPIGMMPYILVLGSAFAVEAAIVTLVLLFWGMELKPVFGALVLANVAVYFVIFLPLFEVTSNLWVAEVAIVGLDGLLIKTITRFDVFRDDSFCPVRLRWGYAFIIAAIGNVVSYCVGAVSG